MTVLKSAASYSRVSTEAQNADDRYGLTRQRAEQDAYAAKHGLVITETFTDVITGKSISRKGLDGLKAAAPRIVIISSIDRLARDMSVSFRLLSELLEIAPEVHSADMGRIDMSEDQNVLTFGLRSLMSHLEHSGIKRRTLSARIAMAERGLHASGMRNYGYLSAKGRAHFHPDHAPIVKRIYNLAASGVSYRIIADTLNQGGVPPSLPERQETYLEDGELKKRTIKTQWHTSTISHLVRNPVYHQGYATWRHYRIQLEPLISTEVWHKAQRRVGAPARHDWALIGHLRCGYCGRRMSARRNTSRGKIAESYKCQSIGRPRCLFGLSRRKTEARVEAVVRAVLSDPVSVAALFRTPGPDAAVAEKLAALDVESREAFETWRRGIITPDELGQVRRELEARRAELATISAPDPQPVEALEEFADMSLREVLELMPIVATLTREDVTLGVE